MKKLIGLLLLPFILMACGEEKTGPVAMNFDRDVSERSGMIISDAKFAVQIRGGSDNRVWKFDDIGDAVVWLQAQAWADSPKTEIWVMDYDNGADWLNAKEAFFVSGYMSPVNYGFAAFSKAKDKSVDFNTMIKLVTKRELSANCEPSRLSGGYKSQDRSSQMKEGI